MFCAARHRAGDDVHLHFEPDAAHADRLAHVFLAVDDEFLRQVCSICWSVGMLTALAVSITRATSVAVTSLSLIATMPLELKLRIWLPAMPVIHVA